MWNGACAGQVDAQHHHPGDPEEDDVVGGLHDRARIEALEVVRLLRPAQRRERPQPGAEPGVEDVVVLAQLGGRAAADFAGRRAGRIGGHGRVAVRAVPGRDSMAPPQLAADVPVAHLGQPVLPDLDEALRQDLGLAGARGFEGGGGERRDADEPLGLEPRLHDVVGALAAPDQHLVGLDRLQVAAGLERLHDLAAGLVAVQAGELGAVLVDPGRVVQHRDHRQAVALAGVVVVLVVGRRDLDRAGPEGSVHHRVGDDRHRAIHERDHGPAARPGRCSADPPG